MKAFRQSHISRFLLLPILLATQIGIMFAAGSELDLERLELAIKASPREAPDLIEAEYNRSIGSVQKADREAWVGSLVKVAAKHSPEMAQRIGQRAMKLAPEAEEMIILALQEVVPTCDDVAGTVYTRVENEPKTVLTVVEDYLAYHASCAPEIVAAAILASKADPQTVGLIVERAVTMAPTQAAGISDAALRAAPDAANEIQAAIDRVLGTDSTADGKDSADGKGGKSGNYEYERDRPIDDWPRLFADVWLIAPSGGIIGAGGRIVTSPNPGPKKPEEPKKPGEEPKKPGEEPKKPGEEPKKPDEEPKKPDEEQVGI